MPVFRDITYSAHALVRMRKRHISRDDVRHALDHGDGTLEDDGSWYFDLGTVRAVVVERDDDTAHVVTVIRLRTHT